MMFQSLIPRLRVLPRLVVPTTMFFIRAFPAGPLMCLVPLRVGVVGEATRQTPKKEIPGVGHEPGCAVAYFFTFLVFGVLLSYN